MNFKTLRGFLIGVALAVASVALAQSVGYFPPPDWTWVYNGGTAVGSATGGVQGAGSINAVHLYVQGVPVIATGGNQTANTVYAGPTTGSAAAPTFRALVANDIPLISLTAGVSGVLPVANGGNGTATPVLTAGANVTITGSWPNYTIAAAGGTGCSTGNPTSVIGLSTVNGSAVTCMRTDGAPALSQTISPTWTGVHLFSGPYLTATTQVGVVPQALGTTLPAVEFVDGNQTTNNKVWLIYTNAGSIFLQAQTDNGGSGDVVLSATRSATTITGITIGNSTDKPPITIYGAANINPAASAVGLTVNGVANTASVAINGSSTSGQSDGLLITAGTTSADYAAVINNHANTVNFLQIFGDGHGTLGPSASLGLQWSAVGAVIIDTPTATGNTALTVDGTRGSVPVISVASTSTAGDATSDQIIERNFTGTANAAYGGPNLLMYEGSGSNSGSIFQHSGGQTEIWQYNNNSPSQLVYWDSSLVGHFTQPVRTNSGVGTSNSAVAYGLGGAANTGMFQGTTGFVSLACAGSTCATFSSSTFAIPQIASATSAQSGYLCYGGSGNVTYDPTNTCLTSSARWKQNIEPLDEGLAEVMQLRPVTYEYKPGYLKTDIGRQVGFVAEDVHAIDPRLTPLDTTGQPRGVEYAQMTALLTRAIQDQQHEIDDLRRQLKRKH